MAITYEPIATYSATSGNGVTFSSIPQTYTDLRIVAMIYADAGNDTLVQFNGDTATNYSWRSMEGDGTSGLNLQVPSSAGIRISNWQSYSMPLKPSLYYVDILNYTSSAVFKTTLSKGQGAYNPVGFTGMTCGYWRNTAAITSIYVYNTGTLQNTCTFTLYGIKAA